MKIEDLHIAVFTTGDPINFKEVKRSDNTLDYIKLLWTLCRQSAVTKISIIQKSDWSQCSKDRRQEIDPRGIISYKYSEKIKFGEQPDIGIGFQSENFTDTIKNYLNVSKIPWYIISFNTKITDILNLIDHKPLEILSQYKDTIKTDGIKIKSKYTGIERLGIIDEVVIDSKITKHTKLAIVNPQTEYTQKKLEEWIFDYEITDTIVLLKKHQTDEQRDNFFVGVKYTLILSKEYPYSGSEYVEMLRLGVLPFFHKDYDSQNNLLDKDHYIRCNTPDELYEKIEYLEKHPRKRIILVKNLQGKFLANSKRGNFVLDIINEANNRNKLEIEIPYKWDNSIPKKANNTVLF